MTFSPPALKDVLARWGADISALGVARGRCLIAATFALFALQNLEVAYYVSQNADSRPVIRAFDDDAGNAIDVAGRSRWVTDNGFASYGPVYYRVASTLSTWFTPMASPGDLPTAEARTRADHFGLMLTSLLCLALLSVVLASFFSREVWLLALLATAFEWTFLHSSAWQYLILRAHPDHLLGLAVALACIASAYNWRDPESLKWRRVSAWAWGIVHATKPSVILFTPFIALAFVWHQRRDRARRSLQYAGHVALAYFAIGFPQNFNIPRLYRFMKYQSGYSMVPTTESVHEWFTLWGDQLLWPLTFALLLLGAQRLPRRPNRREAICAALIAFVPFLLLLPQRIQQPHEHYPIPNVTAQLALLIVLFTDPKIRFPKWFEKALLFVLPLAFYVFGLVPRGFDGLLTRELRDRPEARAAFGEILQKTTAGAQLYLDPYTPASNKMPNITVNWRTSKAWVAEKNFDALVLNRPYYLRYFDVDKADYVTVYNAEYAATKDFYDLFIGQPDRIDDAGVGRWHREKTVGQWEFWIHDRAK